VTTCPYCGRGNDDGAQFCIDCGKPLGKAAARHPTPAGAATGSGAAPVAHAVPATQSLSVPPTRPEGSSCPFCGAATQGLLPFCPSCGRRLSAPGSGPACSRCYSPVVAGSKFCATCGAPLSAQPRVGDRGSPRPARPLALVLLDEVGTPLKRYERSSHDTTIGRQDGDIRFPDDPFISPLHAKLSWEEDGLVVRDLGSRNGTWVFLEGPHRLADGDLLLIGAQVIRFRRLGYPGPHSPDADATKRMGSLTPSADIASLTQLRSDGSARDVLHLSPGRDVVIGREQGDWLFPFDPSMSARHALVRSEDADFVVLDAESRNGVALAARGHVALAAQSRILVGDKLLRIELP
jgi:pSer/pThr/pTyr-binding forkhead associated (FHA) protein